MRTGFASGPQGPYTVDSHGNIIYEPPAKLVLVDEVPTPDVSLDDIGKRIITALDRAVKHLTTAVTGGDVSREVIGALKDCSTMVKDMKRDEKDFLSEKTDEQLEEMLKK